MILRNIDMNNTNFHPTSQETTNFWLFRNNLNFWEPSQDNQKFEV